MAGYKQLKAKNETYVYIDRKGERRNKQMYLK